MRIRDSAADNNDDGYVDVPFLNDSRRLRIPRPAMGGHRCGREICGTYEKLFAFLAWSVRFLAFAEFRTSPFDYG